MGALKSIGLGGGCHWCTEAVFQQLKGVTEVKQGYISSTGKHTAFSEAVLLTFNNTLISLEALIKVHLATHASISNHSFRKKYRSAIYYLHTPTKYEIENVFSKIQENTNIPYITKILKAEAFKPSRASIQDYYTKHPDAPFCQRYITPKIELLNKNYSSLISTVSEKI